MLDLCGGASSWENNPHDPWSSLKNRLDKVNKCRPIPVEVCAAFLQFLQYNLLKKDCLIISCTVLFNLPVRFNDSLTEGAKMLFRIVPAHWLHEPMHVTKWIFWIHFSTKTTVLGTGMMPWVNSSHMLGSDKIACKRWELAANIFLGAHKLI